MLLCGVIDELRKAESVAVAVKVFIQQKVSQLGQEKRCKPEMRDAVLQHLTSCANDSFKTLLVLSLRSSRGCKALVSFCQRYAATAVLLRSLTTAKFFSRF
jgi:hypothetical protein